VGGRGQVVIISVHIVYVMVVVVVVCYDRYFDVEDGKLIGSKKVQFSLDDSGNLPTTSEQSVAVDKCKAFVVQNYMGVDRLDDNVRCSSVPPKRKQLRRLLGDFCKGQVIPGSNDLFSSKACPVVFGCSSDGAALFEIEPTVIQSGGELLR